MILEPEQKRCDMRTDRIEKTKTFLYQQLQTDGESWGWQYRYEHSLRVAAVGSTIARAEGFDEELLVIGCLLHDVGYGICRTEEEHANHGALSERVARPFLVELGLDGQVVESICYGILTHTMPDEQLPRPCTPFEASIVDADNIDRFGALRMANTLEQKKLLSKRPDEIVADCDRVIVAYTRYQTLPFGTKTAQGLWHEVLDEQIGFYARLKRQMQDVI